MRTSTGSASSSRRLPNLGYFREATLPDGTVVKDCGFAAFREGISQGKTGCWGRANAQLSNLDAGVAQHVGGRRDTVGLLVGCQLTFVLIGGGIDVAAMSDQSAEALIPDGPYEFLYGRDRWLARECADPVLARVDLPQDLDVGRQRSSDADVVERDGEPLDSFGQRSEALELWPADRRVGD